MGQDSHGSAGSRAGGSTAWGLGQSKATGRAARLAVWGRRTLTAGRPLAAAGARRGSQVCVIQEGGGEHQGEQVEEVIVASDDDQDLQQNLETVCTQLPGPPPSRALQISPAELSCRPLCSPSRLLASVFPLHFPCLRLPPRRLPPAPGEGSHQHSQAWRASHGPSSATPADPEQTSSTQAHLHTPG